jgi:hypothetical protein
MADYHCPRFGGNVERKSGAAVSAHFGLIGALVGTAVSGFACAACGPVSKSEFPPEVRGAMTRHSVIMVLVAVAVLVGLIALIAAIH